jgi:DNA-binding CsgD family transcriptional regulator
LASAASSSPSASSGGRSSYVHLALATALDDPDERALHLGRATEAPSEAVAAELEEAAGRLDVAAVEQGLGVHERLDWPFEHGRTLLAYGVMLRRLGRRRDAAAALDRAASIFASLRNPLWLSRVDAEARRLGGRRGPADALTPTESRVAELAGQGLRNAEIAARLYVTPKTVESTLSRVYRKLGVRSRTELARSLPMSSDLGETGPAQTR